MQITGHVSGESGDRTGQLADLGLDAVDEAVDHVLAPVLGVLDHLCELALHDVLDLVELVLQVLGHLGDLFRHILEHLAEPLEHLDGRLYDHHGPLEGSYDHHQGGVYYLSYDLPVDSGHHVLEHLDELVKDRSYVSTELILQRLPLQLHPVHFVVDAVQGVQGVLIQDVAHVLGFLCVGVQGLRSCEDERVQLLPALAEYRHRHAVTGDFVVYLAEGVYHLKENVIR